MAKKLADLAEVMRDIDFTMLTTQSPDGGLAARPMSNNRDVDYDGDSWFFALDDTKTVTDIESNPNVGLTLHGNVSLLGKPPMFIAAEGKAEILRDKGLFEAHWNSDLDRWFKQGVDTLCLTLIKVHAERLHYWNGEDQGEVTLPG
ncbi:pyridoxamine 5'-phosphate oxidase family protein [Sphingomonas immobilis]|uniref:Pyridoxamine 5'-phosphate oxidase family protein n=1 Tax=Sphingomonas immobilis TaxID=3063997 RepID=A0ABT8ZW74_9SPHN|nr:pyridoxamine 5'-phosphate oxidase family protein [Sphingomonas sp. CA1-15]MDO7841813.1 pyridoxamine 5'-phosphate oxidase family protein [Sphingomonas sp. CA1-15]